MNNDFETVAKSERALCIHRPAEGQPDYLRETPDGQVYCTKCGKTFKPVIMDEEISSWIEERCKDIIDTIESMKLECPNLDNEYKLVIPLLENLPSKFESVIRNYKVNKEKELGG